MRQEIPAPAGNGAVSVQAAALTVPSAQPAPQPKKQQKWIIAFLLAATAMIAITVALLAIRPKPGPPGESTARALFAASATSAAGLPIAPLTATQPLPGVLSETSSPAPPMPTNTPSTSPAAGALPLASLAPSLTPTTAPSYQVAFYSNRDNLSAIYLMDPDHPEIWETVLLPENYEYTAWPSFCGSRLAFEARDRSFTLPVWIFLYDLNQRSLEPISLAGDPPERLMHPGCSPSGRFMILNSFRAGDWRLSMVDFDVNQIVAEQSFDEYASLGSGVWPQSEDRFVWMGARASGYFDINETRADQGKEFSHTRLVAQGKYPAISPDGMRMVSFCGNLLYLCMVDRATNKLLYQIPVSYFKQIDRKAAPASAAWASNGEWVYFSSSTSGNWDIYRMRPDGSMIQNLTEDWPSDELMPAAR